MYRGGICEKAAENGVLSTAPQTPGPRRFKLVLASCAKLGRFLSLRSAFWFLVLRAASRKGIVEALLIVSTWEQADTYRHKEMRSLQRLAHPVLLSKTLSKTLSLPPT
jgi:hypothetical protein